VGKLIVDWSDEGCATDAGDVLSLMLANVASGTASVVPVEAVLWRKRDVRRELRANWKATSESAVGAN
jgi:hypothetical protein